MLMIVTCNHCRQSGHFDLELKFRPDGETCCGKCGQEKRDFWLFHFCKLECLFGWIEKHKVAEKGIPCRDCINFETGEPCGFSGGFKQNGTCKTCGGEKAVKGSIVKKIVDSVR